MPFGMKIENYRELERKLRRASPDVQKRFNREMKVLAAEIVTEARAHASTFSVTIPPAITATATARGAGVRVSGKVRGRGFGRLPSPIAVLNERKKGAWRHPVFGNREKWVTQKARPSVRPAVAANEKRLRELAERSARAALKEAGF